MVGVDERIEQCPRGQLVQVPGVDVDRDLECLTDESHLQRQVHSAVAVAEAHVAKPLVDAASHLPDRVANDGRSLLVDQSAAGPGLEQAVVGSQQAVGPT